MSDTTESGIDVEAGINPFRVAGVTTVDPATAASGDIGTDPAEPTTDPVRTASGDSAAPKRRGRKPGSKNAVKTKAKNSPDISGLESILFSVHLALAAIAKAPELALDPAEANKLAEAAAQVQAQYEMIVDPKILAWGQLVIVAGSIYAPRVIAISMRHKKEKIERRTNVVNGNFDNHASAV